MHEVYTFSQTATVLINTSFILPCVPILVLHESRICGCRYEVKSDVFLACDRITNDPEITSEKRMLLSVRPCILAVNTTRVWHGLIYHGST